MDPEMLKDVVAGRVHGSVLPTPSGVDTPGNPFAPLPEAILHAPSCGKGGPYRTVGAGRPLKRSFRREQVSERRSRQVGIRCESTDSHAIPPHPSRHSATHSRSQARLQRPARGACDGPSRLPAASVEGLFPVTRITWKLASSPRSPERPFSTPEERPPRRRGFLPRTAGRSVAVVSARRRRLRIYGALHFGVLKRLRRERRRLLLATSE